MSEVKPVLLLDCDGVIADFVGSVVDVLKEHSSLNWSRETFKRWNLFDDIVDPVLPGLREKVTKRISRKGFCTAIRPFYEAKAAVKELRKMARVVVVTAPWTNSQYWMHERSEWLKQHFGFEPADVMFASDKRFVVGDVMVDDREANLNQWSTHMISKGLHHTPLLWDAHHNRGETAFPRITSWQSVIEQVDLCRKCQ